MYRYICIHVYVYVDVYVCTCICIFDILLIVSGCLCMHKHIRAQQTQMHVFCVVCFLTWGKALMPARLVLRTLVLSGNAISALPLGVFDQLTGLQ